MFTVHGACPLLSWTPSGPWLVVMLMLMFAGSVGTFPAFGGATGLAAGSFGVAWYWQLAPRSAGGLNGGSTPACGVSASCVGVVDVVVPDAGRRLVGPLPEEHCPHRHAGHYDDDRGQGGDRQDPAAAGLLRTPFELAIQLALGRRPPLLFGRHAAVLLVAAFVTHGHRVCHAPLSDLSGSVGGSLGRASLRGKLDSVLISGFAAGMLACNCYVLAPRAGSDAVIVDPGQRAMAPLRRILDEHRLTPAAVLLTHGHVDHIWSAQKVADTYGCPAYIHPEDRFMLTDPIKDFGPRIVQLLFGALFREPRQVIELDRDGDKIDCGGITVTVDHTPGHTRGSVVFRVADGPEEVVLSGDTLFQGSVGRTDLAGGSGRDLLGSIVTKLLVLDDATVVLPGHGPSTTIGAERRTNPFLEGLTS